MTSILAADSSVSAEFGVIYLAFGRTFLGMSLLSALTVRRNSPSAGITIVSNVEIDVTLLEFWSEQTDRFIFVADGDGSNRLYKTCINRYSPYSKTLYLDCDTVVCRDLSIISDYLDYFDVGARPGKSPGPRQDRSKQLLSGRHRFEDLVHWNGGVIAFRRSKGASDFFDRWNQRYIALGFKRDQPSLVEAMFETSARVFPLEPRWNNGDSLNGDGLLEKKEIRSLVAVWHYKWDIDNQLRDEIVQMSRIVLPGAVDDILRLIEARRPSLSMLKPRYLAAKALRRMRGRLSY
jgi:hypothetical protein